MDKETTITGTGVSRGCAIVIIILNLLLGGRSVNYLLAFFLSKTIPFIGAALIGLVAGEITIPVAIIIWALRYFGVL